MSEGMLLTLTTRTRVALAIARGIAASLGHDDVTATHIALGVLREAENPAVAVLQHARIDLRLLRQDLEQQLPPRRRPHPDVITLPSTPGEDRLVQQAAAESQLRHSPYLGTEHFLLAILRDASSPAARAFARHALTLDTALAHLDSVHRGQPPA